MELGQALRRAREDNGLSLEEVERATHIRKKYLAALEAEDFDALPPPVHARGFVRNYAAFLDLDPEEVLKLWPEPRQTRPAQLEPATRLSHPGPDAGAWLLVGVVLALVGAAGFYLSRQSLAAPFPLALPNLWSTPAETSTPPRPTVFVVPTVAAVATPTPPRQPTATPRPSNPTATPTPDRLVLQIHAVERAWVAASVDSRAVYTGTLEVGESRTFTATRSVYLHVGNAGGLEVAYNGQAQGLLGSRGQVIRREWFAPGQTPPATPTPLGPVGSRQ